MEKINDRLIEKLERLFNYIYEGAMQETDPEALAKLVASLDNVAMLIVAFI